MTTDKKPRVMSLQGWLTKSSQKAAMASPAIFLADNRSVLERPELAHKTGPILAQLDRDEIYPTPCLLKMQSIVLACLNDIAQEALDQASANTDREVIKNWAASVYNADGTLQTREAKNGDIVELVESFSRASDADRFCDRYLAEGTSNGYAEVINAAIGLMTRIERADAMSRVFAKKKQPFTWQRSKTTKSLGFGSKVQQSRASFSKG